MCNMSHVIDRIKQLSKKHGITMTFLCKQIGKRATYLADVRLGKDKLDESELNVIATTLNTTSAYLRGETDDPSMPEASWIDELKKDPRKEGVIRRLAKKDTDELLRLEKIIDIIKEDE